MNAKKFIIALIAVFIFFSVFDYVFHNILMKDAYQQTSNLWRPEEVMKEFVLWTMLGQFIFSLGFVALFTKAFKRGGIIEGAIFGLLLAVIFIGNLSIWHAVLPSTGSLLISWIVGTTIELILAGMIVALIYQNKTAT